MSDLAPASTLQAQQGLSRPGQVEPYTLQNRCNISRQQEPDTSHPNVNFVPNPILGSGPGMKL
jgi:hypothetical protein